MKKAWIFFKLRMLQIKSDKTGLFFSYVLPLLMLLGVGFPMQMRSGGDASLAYVDSVGTTQTAAVIAAMRDRGDIEVVPYQGTHASAMAGLEKNEIKHFLSIVPGKDGAEYRLYTNSIKENSLSDAAVRGVLDEVLDGRAAHGLEQHRIKSDKYTSYIVILLPGLIGMTLLIIALNGFASVLIIEEVYGIFKSVKVINSSPAPFLAGLFATRLLVTYSVAIMLFLVSLLVFHIPSNIDYFLLFLLVTLGAIAFHGIGLALTAISPTLQVFNGIMNIVQIPLIVLGGVFFSTKAFPDWLQVIADLLPLTQFNQSLQALFFEGASTLNIGMILPQIIGLCVWTVISLAVARYKFRW